MKNRQENEREAMCGMCQVMDMIGVEQVEDENFFVCGKAVVFLPSNLGPRQLAQAIVELKGLARDMQEALTLICCYSPCCEADEFDEADEEYDHD